MGILETSLVSSTPKGSCRSGNKKLSLSKHLPADPAQRMLAAGWAALRSMGPMGAPRASLQQLRGLRGGQLNSGRVQSKESQVAPGQTIVLEEASLVKETQDRINNSLVSGLGDNCQILAVRSDICKIGQLSDRTTVGADSCQIGQLSDRTTVRSDNCQIGQLSVGQLSVGHGQLSEKTVSALKKL